MMTTMKGIIHRCTPSIAVKRPRRSSTRPPSSDILKAVQDLINMVETVHGLDGIDYLWISRTLYGATMTDGSEWPMGRWRDEP
jgi:hypothetical protein